MPVDRFGGGSLMVWGAVHYAGKTSLIVIRQIPNAQRYCDGILRPVVAPFMRRNNRYIFQQDHTRPHIAPLSSNVLLAKNVNTFPWPSRSPDLAPIEHIWDMLNRQIRENHHPFNSLQELENALIIEWNAIQQYKIQNLIRGCRDTITGFWYVDVGLYCCLLGQYIYCYAIKSKLFLIL